MNFYDIEAKVQSSPLLLELLETQGGFDTHRNPGMIPWFDMQVIVGCMELIGANSYLEMGVNKGGAAAVIHRLYPDMHIAGIDFPNEEMPELTQNLSGVQGRLSTIARGQIGEELIEAILPGKEGNIKIFFGDSRKRSSYPDGVSYDLVLVDASPQYDDAMADFQVAMRMLNEGGLIVVHNTGHYFNHTARFAVERIAWAWETTYIDHTWTTVVDPSCRGIIAGVSL